MGVWQSLLAWLLWPSSIILAGLTVTQTVHSPFLFLSIVHNSGKTNWFQRVLSIFSIGLSAMMCCLGVYGILEQSQLAEIFVSIYMILFAVLLFAYELMWWKGIDSVNKNLRMNFGFLYSVKGKAAYLIFVAFLVIGLKDDVSVAFLRYLTGISFLATGVLMLFVHFTKPELLSSYQAPTAGLGEAINTPVWVRGKHVVLILVVWGMYSCNIGSEDRKIPPLIICIHRLSLWEVPYSVSWLITVMLLYCIHQLKNRSFCALCWNTEARDDV